MNTEPMPRCPQCGETLPSDAPDGLCPKCLMAFNLKTETAFTDQATVAQPPLPPEQIAPLFPQLEILECLGRGGMGVVYKARQKTLNRFVALKLLAPERVHDAEFADRFTREAQALAALSHPNIVTIHDFGQAGGFYFLLMEFVDGMNLRQLLRTQKFTPEAALAIVPPLCDALQFAHDRRIVHRDIKPENLLLDKAGRVKVADFGIAKMLGTLNGGGASGESTAQENATRNAIGTPGYSAPEQKSEPQRVDNRADIYSLGVVFYEMLTGELPGKNIAPPSSKVQLDVRLDEIVLRALERKPELRYQQVSEVKTMVETLVTGPEPSGVKAGIPPGLAKPEAEQLGREIRDALKDGGLAGLIKRALLRLADQVLLLFDFTANIVPLVERDGRRRFNFWPFILLFFSTIGFMVNGLIVVMSMVRRTSHGADPFALTMQEVNMLIWGGICGLGRLAALNLGGSPVASGSRSSESRKITRQRMFKALRKLLHLAVLVVGSWLVTTWVISPADSAPAKAAVGRWLAIVIGVALLAAAIRWYVRIVLRLPAGAANQASLSHFWRAVNQDGTHLPPAEIAPKTLFGKRLAVGGVVLACAMCLSLVFWNTVRRQAGREQVARGALQVELGNKLAQLLGDNEQRITYASIAFNFIPDAPRIVVKFDGLRGWRRGAQSGAPQVLQGGFILNSQLPHSNSWQVSGTGDLAGINTSLQTAVPGFVWWSESRADEAGFRPMTTAPFVAHYPGGTIELVAVAKFPETNEACWLPDGSLAREPFPKTSGNFWVNEKNLRLLAIRIRGRDKEVSPASLRFAAHSPGSSMGYSCDYSQGDYASVVERFAIKAGTQSVNFQIGVADGDWETISTLKPGTNAILANGVHKSASKSYGDGWQSGVDCIVTKDGNMSVSFRYPSKDDYQTRMVALMSDGSHNKFPTGPLNHADGLVNGMASFNSAEADKIVAFESQKRKYQWVEFRNVSVQPGHKTTVVVRDVGGKSETEAALPNPPALLVVAGAGPGGWNGLWPAVIYVTDTLGASACTQNQFVRCE